MKTASKETVEVRCETLPGFFRESLPAVVIGRLPRRKRGNPLHADTEMIVRVIEKNGDYDVDIRWCRLKKDDSWGTTPTGVRLPEEAYEALVGMAPVIREATEKLRAEKEQEA